MSGCSKFSFSELSWSSELDPGKMEETELEMPKKFTTALMTPTRMKTLPWTVQTTRAPTLTPSQAPHELPLNDSSTSAKARLRACV